MKIKPLHYHLPLFPAFQLLDITAPVDILHLGTLSQEDMSDLTLTVSAETLDPVSLTSIPTANANYHFNPSNGSNNTAVNQQLVPQYTFDDVLASLKAGQGVDGNGDINPIDVLIVPGGPGTRLDRLYDDSLNDTVPNTQEVRDFILAAAPYVRHSIITVCTGSQLLSKTGLLDGRKATTNSNRYKDVSSQAPKVDWQPNTRWVRDVVPEDAAPGSLQPGVELWSSAGITAGFDVMLEFISAHYGGVQVGKDLAKTLEYRWERNQSASYFL